MDKKSLKAAYFLGALSALVKQLSYLGICPEITSHFLPGIEIAFHELELKEEE